MRDIGRYSCALFPGSRRHSEFRATFGMSPGDGPCGKARADVTQSEIIEALLTEPRFDMARRILERNGRLSA